MAKEYTVELGGKARKLRFTQADARALYERFKKPLHDLFWDDVLGVRNEQFGAAVNPVALHAALLAALRHDSPAINESGLDAWLEKYIAGGGTMATLAIQVMNTATMAGITNGTSFDFEEMVEKTLADLGKAPEPKPEVPPESAPES